MRLFQPEDREPEHDPRLLDAVGRGDRDSVTELLASGTMVDSRDEDEYTALMIAASEGHFEIFEALLTAGANPFLAAFGETALVIACLNGRIDIVRSWIDRGLDVSLDDDDGIQALLAAASGGHVEVIRCLSRAGVKAVDEAIAYASDLGEHALRALREGGALEP